MPATTAPPKPTHHGWPLLAVAVVVGIEALGLAASAIWLIAYQLLGHRPHDPLDAWLVFVFAALMAMGLAFVWRGIRLRRRWSRSPAVLTQLLAVPVGFNACGDGVWWLGVPVIACAVVGLVGLFAPSTTQAFVGD